MPANVGLRVASQCASRGAIRVFRLPSSHAAFDTWPRGADEDGEKCRCPHGMAGGEQRSDPGRIA